MFTACPSRRMTPSGPCDKTPSTGTPPRRAISSAFVRDEASGLFPRAELSSTPAMGTCRARIDSIVDRHAYGDSASEWSLIDQKSSAEQ